MNSMIILEVLGIIEVVGSKLVSKVAKEANLGKISQGVLVHVQGCTDTPQQNARCTGTCTEVYRYTPPEANMYRYTFRVYRYMCAQNAQNAMFLCI